MNNVALKKVILWGCGDGGQYAFENLKLPVYFK